jgi:hypothetical protein
MLRRAPSAASLLEQWLGGGVDTGPARLARCGPRVAPAAGSSWSAVAFLCAGRQHVQLSSQLAGIDRRAPQPLPTATAGRGAPTATPRRDLVSKATRLGMRRFGSSRWLLPPAGGRKGGNVRKQLGERLVSITLAPELARKWAARTRRGHRVPRRAFSSAGALPACRHTVVSLLNARFALELTSPDLVKHISRTAPMHVRLRFTATP